MGLESTSNGQSFLENNAENKKGDERIQEEIYLCLKPWGLDVMPRKFSISIYGLCLLKYENSQQRPYGNITLTRGCDISINQAREQPTTNLREHCPNPRLWHLALISLRETTPNYEINPKTTQYRTSTYREINWYVSNLWEHCPHFHPQPLPHMMPLSDEWWTLLFLPTIRRYIVSSNPLSVAWRLWC